MGVNQYFRKERCSNPFHDSRYADIPYMYEFGLETVTECDACETDSNSMGCYGCWPWSKVKITRDDLPRITADMASNETLFADIMDEIGQDYFWFSEA